ncbi:MAG: ferrous iron transport protein A [Candidatus Omnitrophica bacterium]|nr:ferrous iron transport protein A [Candidatus Omnitrophota bacterium]
MQHYIVLAIIALSSIYLVRHLWQMVRGKKGACGSCGHTRQCSGLRLCDVNNGSSVRIKQLIGETSACQRLRELGICESACIRKVADNGSLICCIDDSKVIISEHLAKNILVEQLF